MSGNERDTDSSSDYDLSKDDDVASVDSEEEERIWKSKEMVPTHIILAEISLLKRQGLW